MNFFKSTGLILQPDNALVITCHNYAATAISEASIVITDATNNDTTQGQPAVATTTSADSVNVFGVVVEPGGIPAYSSGRVCIYGLANVTLVSGSYTAGQYLGTSTTAGAAAVGTYANGSALGKVYYAAAGTITTCIAFVCLH